MAETHYARCAYRQEYYGGWFSYGYDESKRSTRYHPRPNWTQIRNDGWMLLNAEAWHHILEGRPQARQKRALGMMRGLPGLILLPDDCTVHGIETAMRDWSDNRYVPKNWAKMKKEGAVFLPATGRRTCGTLNNYMAEGWYWIGQPSHSQVPCALHFMPEKVEIVEVDTPDSIRMPLRLATDVI